MTADALSDLGYLGAFLARSRREAEAAVVPPVVTPAPVIALDADALARYELLADIMRERRRHGLLKITHEPPAVLRRRRIEWDDPDSAEAFIRRGPAEVFARRKWYC